MRISSEMYLAGKIFLPFYAYCCFFFLLSCSDEDHSKTTDYSGWETYAGTVSGMRYSSATEINRENVADLQEVWRYSTGDRDKDNRSQIQTNPVIVEGILYGISPRLKLFALDAATGKQKWIFDPAVLDTVNKEDPMAFFKVSRGLVYKKEENGPDIIFHAVGKKIYAINAENGEHLPDFGSNGAIDLSRNLGREEDEFNSFIAETTPGVLFKNLLIVSMRVAESADAAPGHIRAYNTKTGELEWIFHTIPHPGEEGYDSWPDKDAWKKLGGANCWAGMSLDKERGIVYVPTGSVSGDFYGGFREGTNLFANSLIALDAATGKYIWHYQIVHHDLWDRDLPANPNLVTLHKDGKTIDAVAQITKHGYIFIFDRVTGEPVYPIEEQPVPQKHLPGEKPWPTQPIPSLPEPFARQHFSREDVSNLDEETHQKLLQKYDSVKYAEMFTPPSKEGGWIFPGFDGGGEWGGAAVDPETQIMYVNSSELPWSLTMIDVPKEDTAPKSLQDKGEGVYNKYCMSCHGIDRQGNGESYPALDNLGEKYEKEHILSIIENGRNMMPAFGNLKKDEKEALLAYMLDLQDEDIKEPLNSSEENSLVNEVPYTMTGYNRFLDENGYPGITPPWGTLNAVNLNTGKLLWKVPLGEYPELSKKGIPVTGTENYGGPVVTRGGLVFIAATKDSKIRAFDKTSGEVLWEAKLPVPGYATPAVYTIEGKEYLVIACGGGKIGSPSGDEYLAFALP
ncbi:PQQ-binding-like beta-propeller repeat protein [Christiangramia crocea]|uniref:PQQ-binding-like beta-propeller repeat protein n=1 Tax=Christiangramia crocea TaxID=2904124 RepID=A0A9X1V0R2_9FLAO|nr:PQQ-binding-like beta-propeller repeat protein [Gramella crocea]MCG9972763.1 PQQ-binding-like beta-propeller repeat protein [Gramella crocea]